jgi:TfoX/Sxy family transcriptional regulator of competence genes
MAYNEKLAERIREELFGVRNVEEKNMMGGLTFMVNGKMCVGIANDDLMARIDAAEYDKALERKGCREMDFTGRPMKGFVFIGPEGTKGSKDLTYWITLAMEFNKKARPSKKKKKLL